MLKRNTLNQRLLSKFYITIKVYEKKDYVKPNAQVLSLYTDEFMEGGFHAQSGIKGSLTPGDDEKDPEEENPTAF